MRQERGTDTTRIALGEPASDSAWNIVLAAAAAVHRIPHDTSATFALTPDNELQTVADDDPEARLAWRCGAGWEAAVPRDDPRRALLDLYLPACNATAARPTVIGHLGQSLDGFIATHSGESQWITGGENIVHLHRLRALCDAVVVGAGTIAADDPQLTTRLVPGPNPLRVILDPMRRLSDTYRVFQDESAETLYVCGRSFADLKRDRFGRAQVAVVDDDGEAMDLVAIVQLLQARGCTRIFVEGGGVTVSMFIEANLLDRLHVAVAPLLIGDGRPAIRLRPRAALGDCPRPNYRVFRMGADVLFDFDLRSSGADAPVEIDLSAPVTRVI